MARRGHAGAASGLAQCLRRGQKWRECLDALEAAGGETLLGSSVKSKDVEQLLLIVGAEELADAAQVVKGPWEEWARALPALRFVAAARANRTVEPKPSAGPVSWIAHRLSVPERTSTEHMTVAELLTAATKPGPIRAIVDALLRDEDQATEQALRAAAAQGGPRERAVALHVLGKQGCVDYLNDAKEFLCAQTERSSKSDEALLRTSYIRYLQAIAPDLTLPLARDWLCAPWPLSHAAEQILSLRATPADRCAMEEAGKAALGTGEMYRLCSMIEGLAVIGAAESVPFLCCAYAEAPYSFARGRALTALSQYAEHDAVRDLMVEALWDCEADARRLACAAVPLTSLAAVRRLKEISSDGFEDPETREAAASRGSRRQGP
jgi:hypothetical protein